MHIPRAESHAMTIVEQRQFLHMAAAAVAALTLPIGAAAGTWRLLAPAVR